MSFTRAAPALLIAGSAVNPRRIIFLIYALLMAAFAVTAGAMMLDARAQYKQLKQTEILNQQKLADALDRLKEKETMLNRLKSDPELVERAIRQRLNYAKPGEVIFRFPD